MIRPASSLLPHADQLAHDHLGAAHMWTTYNGDRGTRSMPIPEPHDVYGFLKTSPNAVFEPIHPKAMLVILTT
jgi:putative SOS response-associated peptidase YedK